MLLMFIEWRDDSPHMPDDSIRVVSLIKNSPYVYYFWVVLGIVRSIDLDEPYELS